MQIPVVKFIHQAGNPSVPCFVSRQRQQMITGDVCRMGTSVWSRELSNGRGGFFLEKQASILTDVSVNNTRPP